MESDSEVGTGLFAYTVKRRRRRRSLRERIFKVALIAAD
jgi:hypothetical protein